MGNSCKLGESIVLRSVYTHNKTIYCASKMVWCILESEFPKEEYNKDVLAGWGTGGGGGEGGRG